MCTVFGTCSFLIDDNVPGASISVQLESRNLDANEMGLNQPLSLDSVHTFLCFLFIS